MKKFKILLITTSFVFIVNIISCKKTERITNTIPNSPINLSAQLATYNSVNLKWVDNSNNETGFKIERKLSSGAFELINTSRENDSTYLDQNLQSNKSYTYRLQSFNAVGNSNNYSNEVTINTGLPQGVILALNCSGTNNNGNLIKGEAANGVNSIISYTVGNGGTHSGQVVNSTGVTGLIATLLAGTFATGNGTLTYDITGIPSDSGTAIFALNIGGRTCTLTRRVSLPIGVIASLDCNNATNVGILTWGQTANGVSASIPYTGGNGGTYSGQSISSTGVTGLTATILPGAFSNGNGSLNIIITGTPSSSGIANFTISIAGQNCTFSRNVAIPVGSIASLNLSSSTGTLTAFESANGVSSTFSYTGGNGGTYSDQVVNSTGITGLTASISAGTFAVGSGNLTYTISGIPSGGGTANFTISIGGQSRTFSRNVNLPIGIITSLDCANATNFGTLTSGQTTTNAFSNISYTGGNGGTYSSQSVSSTGVTGLTANLSAGNFATGSGDLSFTISGIPNSVGVANFSINIGSQICTLSRTIVGSSNASCGATGVHNTSLNYGTMTDQNGNLYKTIIIGNQEWMAENLKATSFRNGSTIFAGNNGQPISNASWAAFANSGTSATCVYLDMSSYACPYGRLYNWYAVTDSRNLCPSGWHVPNQSEIQSLIDYLGGTNIAGLKMKSTSSQYTQLWTIPGDNSSGFSGLPSYFRTSIGTFAGSNNGRYWTSSPYGLGASIFVLGNSDIIVNGSEDKNTGLYVRCVHD
jgi:hypothetical protein